MNSSALAALKEKVRLAKLRQGIAMAHGGVAPEHIATAQDAKIEELTHKIEEVSQKVNGYSNLAEMGVNVNYNEKQRAFIEAVVSGKPVALTGPAGSGKTTAVKGAIAALLSSGKILPFGPSVAGHKHLDSDAPGVACVAFTNKAVENMKKVLPRELRGNCLTIHKLLEYGPEYFTDFDEKGNQTTKMRFVPKYHEENPLPEGIQTLIIDEASMLAVDLWNTLADAIQHRLQVILIGDIQQLPPVFGKPIFIYAMRHGITKIELTEVHRQALESPIINLAHMILGGKQIHAPKIPEMNVSNEHGTLLIKPWKKSFSDIAALQVIKAFLGNMMDQGEYDPMNDCILTPFNVNFGTIAINNIVADHLVDRIRKENPDCSEAKVYEVIAGIKTRYFRIGDKVLYNKTEHVITAINRNAKYYGKLPRQPSNTMNYHGIDSNPNKDFMEEVDESVIQEVDDILDSMTLMGTDGEKEARKKAPSHIITLYSATLDQEVTLDAGGEVANLELGYAITVHKSQGSEYDRVLFITHSSQNTMLFRELIYTAVTRAKRDLIVICPPNLFVQGINTQRIPGKTLDEKLDAFDRACQLQKGATEQPKKLYLFEEE